MQLVVEDILCLQWIVVLTYPDITDGPIGIPAAVACIRNYFSILKNYEEKTQQLLLNYAKVSIVYLRGAFSIN